MFECWETSNWACVWSMTEPVTTVVGTTYGITIENTPSTRFSFQIRTRTSSATIAETISSSASIILSPISFSPSTVQSNTLLSTTRSDPLSSSSVSISSGMSSAGISASTDPTSTISLAIIPVTNTPTSIYSASVSAANATSIAAASTPASTLTTMPSSDAGLSTSGKVAAILIPILVLFAFFIIAGICWVRMRRRERERADQLEARATWFQPDAAEKLRQKMMEMDPAKVGGLGGRTGADLSPGKNTSYGVGNGVQDGKYQAGTVTQAERPRIVTGVVRGPRGYRKNNVSDDEITPM